MQAKTSYKLSRASVATVLAASTVTLGLPAHPNAAVDFKDVKATDFFYDAVYELASSNIVSGYIDSKGVRTFKPYQNVTRGEAAKMLALSLNLDVTNATNNQFKDIKPNHKYYSYIAALANKGVINGMPDGTFRPDEPVLRGAMAKMVALGYEYTLATHLTHPFSDVKDDNIFRYHIQTLVNLNVTKGTSAVQFSPNKTVTRGELATFISRANKVTIGKPTYVVDNVVGNKIYINSVGYTIGSNVSKYINQANRAALIGAHIEGTFANNTLTAVSKLTLNATGSSTNIYTLNGNGATFNGDLVLNGSYLKITNLTLTGKTIVSETPRKSLATYNRTADLRIASVSGSGMIDWNKPTNPDDGNLNNGPGAGDLNTPKPPNSPYTAKLDKILKYIDFDNSDVRNLIIEQTRSYIAAKYTLPRVTVARDVEFVELQADIDDLYLEGDESLTIYGKHYIETVYKNALYSVFFNTDSYIETMIVDNANGWIDLGDFVWIENVIIPPKTTPNDIFDDYAKDTDKIGNIEDNTGEEVDRNPIENGIVPDVTKPIIASLTVVPDSNRIDATLTVNETGKYHYMILPKGSLPPTAREIVSAQSGLSGKGTITELNKVEENKYTTTFISTGLQSVTEYVLYLVHVDDAGNFSARYDVEFPTKDGTPPQFETATAVGLPGGRRIKFDFKPSESGKYYYIVRQSQNQDNTITVKNVIDLAEASGTVTKEDALNGMSNIIRSANGEQLLPSTNYFIYAVLVDDSGNPIEDVKVLQAPTVTLDEDAPFVTGPPNGKALELVPFSTSAGNNKFLMYFNEELDKTTAEDVRNYALSGTGIINVPGQTSINPTKVEYNDSGATPYVTITIPSLTGFVHGDTLRVTVSENVLDLAENPFENINNKPERVSVPRNYAQYQHTDNLRPDLLITNVERDPSAPKSKVKFNVNKAGTVYYLIASDQYESKILGMKPEDFVAEFGNNPTTEFNTVQGGKIYLEGARDKLSDPLTAEIGDSEFLYDYSDLSPSTFESYKIFIVLKDRSGGLSGIQSEVIISDKQAPQISSYIVKSVENDDRKAVLSLTSENEGGRVYYGYEPKYMLNSDGKYELNPKFFNGTTPIQYGVNTQLTDAERKDQFLRNVPNVTNKVLEKGALNNYEITNLRPHTEYVFYMAVEDAFGNFTVQHTPSNANLPRETMIRQLYTDGTKPHVINNNVVRDPFGNFIFTFNEALNRRYDNLDTLEQVSDINATTALTEILTIVPDATGSSLKAEDFEIVSYEEGTYSYSPSKLVIRPTQGVTVLESFKVNLKLPDQTINTNTPNYAIENLINYKYPGNINGNLFRSASLMPDNYPNNANNLERSTVAEIEVTLGVDVNWNQNYYYAVLNEAYTIGASGLLDPALVKSIIENADAQSELELDHLISYGKGKINGPSDLSSVKTIYALQYGKNPATDLNVFFKDARLVLFTVDQYGNIVWARTNDGQYHIKIGPKQ